MQGEELVNIQKDGKMTTCTARSVETMRAAGWEVVEAKEPKRKVKEDK